VLCFWLAGTHVYCSQAGWDLLKKNRIEEALGEFEKADSDRERSVSDLEGLYQIYRLKCRVQRCVEINLELLRRLKGIPLASVCIDRLKVWSVLCDCSADINTILTKLLLDDTVHPVVRNSVTQYLYRLSLKKRDYTRAEQLFSRNPSGARWNFMAGPFYVKEDSFLSVILPPETDLSAGHYTWNGDTVHRTPSGFCMDTLASRVKIRKRGPGIIYCVSGFRSDRDRNILLSCQPEDAVKIWLNRYPVYFPEEFRISTPTYVNVTVRKGINVIVVKTMKKEFSVRLFNKDLTPFTYIPVQSLPENELKKGLETFYGFRFSQKVPAPECGFTDKTVWYDSLKRDYFRSVSMEKYREFVFASLSMPEKSGFGHLVLAEYYKQAAQFGPDSPVRMEREYRKELDEAVGYLGEMPLLLKWRAEFLIKNNLLDKGYADLKKALTVSDNSTAIQASLAAYFRKRKWEIEEERVYKNLTGSAPCFLTDYCRFLKNDGRYVQAREILEKAYRIHAISVIPYFDEFDTYAPLEKVEKTADEILAHFPEQSPRIYAQLGVYYNACGLKAKAKKALNHSLEHDPAYVPALREYARTALKEGDGDTAAVCLEKLAEQGKDVPHIYRRIRNLKHEKLFVRRYDVDLMETFTKTALQPEQYPRSDHVNLLDVSCVQVHKDGSYEALIHNAYLAVTKNSVQKLGEVKLPSDPDSLIMCRTISPEGDISFPASIKDTGSTRIASMPDVVPGAIVEYAYMIYGKKLNEFSDFSTSYEFGASREPTLHAVLAVACPKDKKLYYTDNKGIEPEERVEEGYRTYCWRRSRLPAIHQELNMPSMDEIAQQGRIAGRDRWHTFLASYFYDTEHFYSSQKIDAKGEKLLSQGTGWRAGLKNCLEWVRDNIEDGHEARTIRDCVLTGKGPPRLRKKLLRYWLGKKGMGSSDAFVNKQFYLRENRETGISGLTYFPNSLLVVSGGRRKPGLWIDINSYYHFSDIFSIDGNAVNEAAIFKREGKIIIGRVKEIENDLVNSEYYLTFTLEETGDCGVKAEGYIFGALAAKLRKIVRDPQKKKKIRETLARKILPRISMGDNTFLHLDTYSEPVEHRFSGRILNFARSENSVLSFNPFFQDLDIDEFLGRTDRDYDFVLNSPRFERYTAAFIIPNGYVVCGLPERCVITSQYGLFITDFRLKGNRLEMAVSCTIPAMRIPPVSYRKFTDFLKDIRTHLQKRVMLRAYDASRKPESIEAFLPIKK